MASPECPSGGTTVLRYVTLDLDSVGALPTNSTLAMANTAGVVFGPDLSSAIQLNLMIPIPPLTYFSVTHE
jgi:hypothetical protein